jgi:hypothetical protein
VENIVGPTKDQFDDVDIANDDALGPVQQQYGEYVPLKQQDTGQWNQVGQDQYQRGGPLRHKAIVSCGRIVSL